MRTMRWVFLGLPLIWVMSQVCVAGEEAKGASGDLVPLKTALPIPMFRGTPKTIKLDEHMEKPTDKPRPDFLIPKGCENLALKKAVTSSDNEPVVGELAQITDGNKEGSDGCYVELGPGRQWVQIDLQQAAKLFALVVWHYHGEARIYHDVVVQAADDADFITNVRTLFNNDYDNSSGLGIGKELEYLEGYEGRLIEVKGETARYLRLYSKGSTASDLNHYTEIEVWGRPAK